MGLLLTGCLPACLTGWVFVYSYAVYNYQHASLRATPSQLLSARTRCYFIVTSQHITVMDLKQKVNKVNRTENEPETVSG